MFCGKCGALNGESAMFCSSCRAKMDVGKLVVSSGHTSNMKKKAILSASHFFVV